MLKIFLMAISLSMFGCSKSLPTFPTISKWMIDYTNNKCAEFRLIDPENQIYQYVQSMPLSECNGMFALPPEDDQKIRNWIELVKKEYEKLKACQKKTKAELPPLPFGDSSGS